jgi:hypothetical protein
MLDFGSGFIVAFEEDFVMDRKSREVTQTG